MSAHELVRRLVALADAHPDGVVAFDADGTLWPGDVGDDYLRYVIEHASLHAEVEPRLAELARAYGLDPSAGAKATLRAILNAYGRGRFPEDVLCEVITWCAAGGTEDEVAALARASLVPDLAERLTPELGPVIEWVRSRGITAWIVSASPAFVVRAALAAVGGRVPVAPERVVAFEPRWEGGAMAADVRRPLPYADGKVTCLLSRLGPRPLLCAFGDSGSDAPLLATADLGVAVRPKSRLMAARVPGLVVLARSDEN